jgi:hypothetical protein
VVAVAVPVNAGGLRARGESPPVSWRGFDPEQLDELAHPGWMVWPIRLPPAGICGFDGMSAAR